MPRFILDNSLTMAWYFEDEATPFADEVLDNRLRDAARRVGVALLDEM